MRGRSGSIFRLRLEGKCRLYMGLVLAAMAIGTYLWISWREKVLLYVQTGKIYSRMVLDDWERIALDAQAAGNVGISHALSSFPREHSGFYWRHLRRESSRRLNLPADTFELGALEAFDNDCTVEDLERVQSQLSSLAKSIRGPREPEFLRSFLASLRRPGARAGHRMLVRAFSSTKGQRRLRATLTRVSLALGEEDLATYWATVQARLKEEVFDAARREALQGLYRRAEREALLGTLDVIESLDQEASLREAIQSKTVRDPDDVVAAIRAELTSPVVAEALRNIRSDPDETMETLLAALPEPSSRDVAEELFNRRLRAIARERLQPGREAVAEPDDDVFTASAQKRILDETRAMLKADADLPPQELIAQLQVFEGLDVVDAMVYALTRQENAPLRRQLTDQARQHGAEWLHGQVARIDPVAAARLHPNDTRRLIRALEVHRKTGRPISHWQRQFDVGRPAADCRVFVLDWPKPQRDARIEQRVQWMFAAGLVDEVRRLLTGPRPMSRTARQAVGYREVIEHLEGRRDLDETVALVQQHTRQLAKRQSTWFRSLSECRFVPVSSPFVPAEVAVRIVAQGQPAAS